MKQDFQTALKALGKQARQEAERRKQMESEERKAAADQLDFAKEMSGITPLKSSQRYEPPRDLSPIKPRANQDEGLEEADYFYIGDGQWLDIPPNFSKNGQGQNDIRRLQSGYYDVVADVDLHGYTQEEAQKVLNEFIDFVQKRGVCGEIVHGSGLGSSGYRPVLKNLVRRWLMAHPDVLAYAEPHKNNDGAVRILLKRRFRQENGR